MIANCKLIWVVLLLGMGQLFAQSNRQLLIRGEVVDSETLKPIPHAEVFISGTSYGCITDIHGKFNLKLPYLPCTLVADHVSYDSFIEPINKTQEIKIELTPSNFSLQEVSVSAKNKRKKNLRFFYAHFIPENKSQIKVLNDSVLVFRRDKMSFSASSNELLIVENNYLGYRIKVLLKKFSVIALDSPNGKQIPLNSSKGGEVMQLSGYYHYEPLDDELPDFKSYFNENRRKSYYGSYRHFLKSIYDGEPEKQGFEIIVSPEDEEAAFYQIPSELEKYNVKEYFIQADELTINYHFDDQGYPIPQEEIGDRYIYTKRKSVIYPSKEPFIIRENGTSPKLTFVIDGLMATKSFANSLPDDYIPSKHQTRFMH